MGKRYFELGVHNRKYKRAEVKKFVSREPNTLKKPATVKNPPLLSWMYTLDFGIRTTSASQADEFRIQHLATFALQHPKLLTTDTLTSPPRSMGFVFSYL